MRKVRVPKVITNADKNAIYNILLQCYKAGVRDAEFVNDAVRCKEFINETRKPHVYGRVTLPSLMDWKKWRYAIITMQDTVIERDGCIALVNKILNPRSYFACLLPLSQYFYNQGLQDWNDYPTIHNFGEFNGNSLVRWTKKGIVKRSRKNMFVDVQRFAFEIGAIGDASNDKKALTTHHFDWFCREFWTQSLTSYERKNLY